MQVDSLPDAMASYFDYLEVKKLSTGVPDARKMYKPGKTIDPAENSEDVSHSSEKEVEDKAGLFAVIVHSGRTCTSGHYCTYVQFGTRWYKMDDMRVAEAQNTFLQTLGDQPYLLFYKTLPRPYID